MLLPTWRIEDEVRKAALRLDPDSAAQRTAAKNAGRGVELHPTHDDQAWVGLSGPAVPLTRWYTTLDAKARALKAAGDPRTLDALRFDLATSTYPCDTHSPADPTAPAADSAMRQACGESAALMPTAEAPVPTSSRLPRRRQDVPTQPPGNAAPAPTSASPTRPPPRPGCVPRSSSRPRSTAG